MPGRGVFLRTDAFKVHGLRTGIPVNGRPKKTDSDQLANDTVEVKKFTGGVANLNVLVVSSVYL